jgi:hypothetical protein
MPPRLSHDLSVRASGLVVLAVAGLFFQASPSSAPAPPSTDTSRSAVAERGYSDDVADYTLRASLNPADHTVHGEGTIRWRNASSVPVRELWVHLYLNAFKNERSAFLRERIGGRGSTTPEDWGWIDVKKLALHGEGEPIDLWPAADLHGQDQEDETDARVPLPRPVAPGDTVTLDVVFDDKLPTVVERTGYRGSFHMVGQWFPKIARLEHDGTWAHFPFHHLSEFYADFGAYDVTLDVPEPFVLGATGPAVEERVENGRRIERHTQKDVHDFAWTAWDLWQTLRETVDGVDVKVLYPPGFGAVARRDLATVRFALPYYSARYGRYPYGVLTVVHPQSDAGEAGGMEYPTLITTEGPWWTPPGVRAPEIVTIHELGHQWFYGLLASNEAAWPFLDEGINQYAEAEAMAKWKGPGSLVDFAGLRVADIAADAAWAEGGAQDEPIAKAASEFTTGANYGRLVYDRTASILETLSRVYGEEDFAKAIGTYSRRYRFEHPGPEDFVRTMSDGLGPQAGEQLRTGLFAKGWVDYAVDGVYCEESKQPAGFFDTGGKREKSEGGKSSEGGYDASVLVRRRGTLVFPVEVELTFADGTTRRERWSGEGDAKRFDFHTSVALRGAVIDPDVRVVVDRNLENNHGVATGEGRGAWGVLERALYAAELAIQAVSP